MVPQQARDLSNILNGTFIHGDFGNQPIGVVFTDSRKVYEAENALFIAIKGPYYNGHHFIQHCYTLGIRKFLVSEAVPNLPEDAVCLRVDNTTVALQQWATYARQQFKDTVIGITGSNGKTMVKEWLAAMLEDELPVCKSPKSYNSQVGVPLSVLPLNANHALGIFEAGISKPGEMAVLQQIIQPKIGIFTHLGSAHDDGFSDRQEKLREKLLLFKAAKTLICPFDIFNAYRPEFEASLPDTEIVTVGQEVAADYSVNIVPQENHSQIVFRTPEEEIFEVPFSDASSNRNITLALAVYMHLNLPKKNLQHRLNLLRAIPMRQEFCRTKNDTVIINDSYSLDWESLQLSLDFLEKQAGERQRTLILSDFPQMNATQSLYRRLQELCTQRNIDHFIGVGPEMNRLQPVRQGVYFRDTDSCLRQLEDLDTKHQAILVKGARKFQLERVFRSLQTQHHRTVLEVNLSAMVRNFNTLKYKLQPGVQTMVMVKAAAYGGGTVEVANMLEKHGADSIGVAYVQEGIALRQSGISKPILVLNPSAEEYPSLFTYQLTPTVYQENTLHELEAMAKHRQEQIAVHLKLDTGMNRLGFDMMQLLSAGEKIKQWPHVRITGIYSHFAAADDAQFDVFSKEQLELFIQASSDLETILGYETTKHIANTAAILRFPNSHLNMVRMGIGLYGHNPTEEKTKLELALTLKTRLSQIRTIAPGASVGYGRKFVATETTKIGTLPIGYADGLPRNSAVGNYKVWLPNLGYAPVLGHVCMDMCMVDLTGMDAKVGDSAIIFGENHGIEELANANQTIPYEILSRISERVKRVYYED